MPKPAQGDPSSDSGVFTMATALPHRARAAFHGWMDGAGKTRSGATSSWGATRGRMVKRNGISQLTRRLELESPRRVCVLPCPARPPGKPADRPSVPDPGPGPPRHFKLISAAINTHTPRGRSLPAQPFSPTHAPPLPPPSPAPRQSRLDQDRPRPRLADREPHRPVAAAATARVPW